MARPCVYSSASASHVAQGFHDIKEHIKYIATYSPFTEIVLITLIPCPQHIVCVATIHLESVWFRLQASRSASVDAVFIGQKVSGPEGITCPERKK
jgi:hypothetical protein